LPALAISACTKVVQIDEAKISYVGAGDGTIVLSAPLRHLSDLKNASVPYLYAFPCGQQEVGNTFVYSIDPDLIRRSENAAIITVSFDPNDPQPRRSATGELCVQLKAEGMSLRHYRSNIVRASDAGDGGPVS
jgi:hypothetical protein